MATVDGNPAIPLNEPTPTFVDRSDATDEELQAAVARFGIFAEEERVERVARALADGDAEDHGVYTWDEAGDELHGDYRRAARHAIEALAPADERAESVGIVVAALVARAELAEAAVRRVEKLLAFYDRHEYASLNVDDLRDALAGVER
jgi:hypothetical protein